MLQPKTLQGNGMDQVHVERRGKYILHHANILLTILLGEIGGTAFQVAVQEGHVGTVFLLLDKHERVIISGMQSLDNCELPWLTFTKRFEPPFPALWDV
jgi:hypothetical protein